MGPSVRMRVRLVRPRVVALMRRVTGRMGLSMAFVPSAAMSRLARGWSVRLVLRKSVKSLRAVPSCPLLVPVARPPRAVGARPIGKALREPLAMLAVTPATAQ